MVDQGSDSRQSDSTDHTLTQHSVPLLYCLVVGNRDSWSTSLELAGGYRDLRPHGWGQLLVSPCENSTDREIQQHLRRPSEVLVSVRGGKVHQIDGRWFLSIFLCVQWKGMFPCTSSLATKSDQY